MKYLPYEFKSFRFIYIYSFIFFLISTVFVYRSFYGMRIQD